MPLGPMELGIILVILIFLFGAGKLPTVMRDLGKGLREIRKATEEDADGLDT